MVGPLLNVWTVLVTDNNLRSVCVFSWRPSLFWAAWWTALTSRTWRSFRRETWRVHPQPEPRSPSKHYMHTNNAIILQSIVFSVNFTLIFTSQKRYYTVKCKCILPFFIIYCILGEVTVNCSTGFYCSIFKVFYG